MPTVTLDEARELKARGTFREGRHIVDLSLDDLSPRPKRELLKGGKQWIRSSADEQAFADGCWFDERQAEYVCKWFVEHLRHCIGEWAGEPFDPMQWQREEILYPLFGWQRLNDRGRIVRRFKRTYIEIPKKNGKSTLAAGIGLYMLVGEGMDGAKVFSYATDKEQAHIVQGTAMQMVQRSPTLDWFLRINLNEKSIRNRQHNLLYRAECSRPGASEGSQGNVAIVDELHAWYGRELWESVEKMGMSWPEPLVFVITTAGTDLDSVCYEQHEYATAIEKGEFHDSELLVCIHNASKDDDILDPRVQDKANPSLGVTLSRDRLNRYINRASANNRELASVKRYMFNIWMRSNNPWLSDGDWDQCFEPVDDDELIDMPCVAGLDLARKWDLSAFAMLFSDRGIHHLRVHAWLPRPRAVQLQKHVDYESWADAGWVTLTDDVVADYDRVEKDVTKLIERFRISQVAYDEKYATELMKRIALATNVDRTEYGQSMVNFAGPTARLEQAIAGGRIKHDGNGLLSWQMANVTVKEDYDNNIRPVRPKIGDHRTIDSVVATVMALGIADEQEADSYYEDNELEFV